MTKQDLPSGEALRKMAARFVGTCLADLKGDPRHIKNGLPTREYMAAHLVAREGLSPVNAMTLAEFADRAVSEAIQSPATKIQK
jgi:hypothetical protein